METLQNKIEKVRDKQGKYRLKNLKEKAKKWIFNNLINTRGGYFVVGAIIFSASTFIYCEAPEYYNWANTGYKHTIKIAEGSVKDGALVEVKTETGALENGEIVNNNSSLTTTSLSIEEQIKKYFGEDYKMAIAIAKAESNLKHDAINKNTNGTIDVGIFQINDCHGLSIEDRLDAEKNIKFAYELYKKQGWSPWSAFKNNSFKKFL